MTLVGEHHTNLGQIRVELRAPGLLVSRASGRLGPGEADVLIRVSEEAIANYGGFVHFLDWRDVSGYESEVRSRCTKWAVSRVPPHSRICILTSNRIVHMGVSAAALAMAVAGRSIESFTSRTQFEAALRAAERVPLAG